jgi:hypothetical protein
VFDILATQALVCGFVLQSWIFTVIGAVYGLHTPLALQADPVTVQDVAPLVGAVHVVVGVDVLALGKAPQVDVHL